MKSIICLRYHTYLSILSDILELVLKNLVVSLFLAVTELIMIEHYI